MSIPRIVFQVVLSISNFSRTVPEQLYCTNNFTDRRNPRHLHWTTYMETNQTMVMVKKSNTSFMNESLFILNNMCTSIVLLIYNFRSALKQREDLSIHNFPHEHTRRLESLEFRVGGISNVQDHNSRRLIGMKLDEKLRSPVQHVSLEYTIIVIVQTVARLVSKVDKFPS